MRYLISVSILIGNPPYVSYFKCNHGLFLVRINSLFIFQIFNKIILLLQFEIESSQINCLMRPLTQWYEVGTTILSQIIVSV